MNLFEFTLAVSLGEGDVSLLYYSFLMLKSDLWESFHQPLKRSHFKDLKWYTQTPEHVEKRIKCTGYLYRFIFSSKPAVETAHQQLQN